VLPGVLGTIQATEAIKIILGKGEPLVGRLLVYDALEMRFQEFRVERRRDCAVCGDRPTIHAPQDAPANRADAAPADLQRLSPQALKNLLDADAAPGPRVCVIDVREQQEFHAGHLSGAMLIPVGELEERLGEIPREGLPVFVCRTGVRSVHAAAIASRNGIAVTAHLEGGLRAWAAAIDPSIDVI
jgi:adenylyltransferase/sulfurtransferase